MRQARGFRGDERRGDEKQRRVALEVAHVGREGASQRRADRDRAHQARQRRAGDEEIEGAGARQQPGHGEHQGEEDDHGYFLRDGDGEDGAGDRAPRVELADERHGHDRRGRGRDGPENEGHREAITDRLVHRHGKPQTHAEHHGRDGGEGKQDRAARDARQAEALGPQRVERQLAPRGERDQGDGRFRDEPQRADLVRADEPEPRRPDREARQQIARDAWQARPPRHVAAQLRREQQEPEGERGARLERAARGETMKKCHRQAQREYAREPTHRRKVIAARHFDNAQMRRYLPDVTTHNWIEDVRFGDDGLVPVVAQSALAGEVLMVAYADRAALERTRDTGEAHYHSRSRAGLWKKGETSGHTQAVAEVRVDCDGDAVLYVVRQTGPACHTGAPTCFGEPTGGTLVRLTGTIARRARERPEGSYTARLLGEGVARLAQKLGEEAVETVVAATAEDGARLASEAADLLYHLLVLLEAKRLPLERVLEELDRRAGARESRLRSYTCTPTTNTPSPTAPNAFPDCWTTSRGPARTRL